MSHGLSDDDDDDLAHALFGPPSDEDAPPPSVCGKRAREPPSGPNPFDAVSQVQLDPARVVNAFRGTPFVDIMTTLREFGCTRSASSSPTTQREVIRDTPANESYCLITPGRVRPPYCGDVVWVAPCARDSKCIGTKVGLAYDDVRASQNGGTTTRRLNKRMGVLASMVFPEEWRLLSDGKTIPRRPCVLCYRYLVGMASLLISTHNAILPRDVGIGLKRVPVANGVGSYREDACIFPATTTWNGILFPSVRFDSHRLRVVADPELRAARKHVEPPPPWWHWRPINGSSRADGEYPSYRIDQSDLLCRTDVTRTVSEANFRL